MKPWWLVALFAVASAASPASFGVEQARRESLRSVPPKAMAEWYRVRGVDVPGVTQYRAAGLDSGLRLVGKMGRGRSWEVDGQDSIVALALGSEVALFNFADPVRPEILSETQLDYMPAQALLCDSLLFTGRNGIDIWDVTDPRLPTHLSHIRYVVSGLAVTDSLLCFVSGDSFYCYNAANPAAPARLGACRDSGYVVTATSDVAVLLTRDLLAFIDITNPTVPRRTGGFGGNPLAAQARGNLCCATFANPNQPSESQFKTIDIRDPANPAQLASLNSVCGVGLSLAGQYAFTSGRSTYEPMRIVNIADSVHPAVVGELVLPSSGEGWGTWADLTRNRACVAWDYCGLQVVDVTNITAPVLDTALLVADKVLDITIDGDRAYVAADRAGLRVLDISNPANPVELGGLDTIASTVESKAVVARDSFAFIGWWPPPVFRVASVADPLNPRQVATCSVPTIPQDMVLRDTLIYGAGRLRFFVVNVARPRQPVLVGSCVTTDGIYFGLVVQDTFAYLIGDVFQVINIARPSAPVVVSSTAGGAAGLAVRDTFAYIPSGWDSVHIYSVANPACPRLISSIPCGVWPWDAVLGESKLYVAASDGWGVDVYDLADPGHPVRRGRASAPTDIRRLYYQGGYVYAALWDAGVAIYETTATAVAEAPSAVARRGAGMSVYPSPTRGPVVLELPLGPARGISVLDATGRGVLRATTAHSGERAIHLDLSQLKRGVYFVEVRSRVENMTAKVVKN